MEHSGERTLGLFGATGIGVGAIVGGGILALAGVAFAAAGPATLLAFLLNGGIAFLTALSFAELAARFPHSGGTYTYAKRVLSVEAAFTLGWIVYFASIVAGVLYAFGFAEYTLVALDALWPDRGLLTGRPAVVLLAFGAIAAYTVTLSRSAGGGGNWATIGKVVIFAALIAVGLAIFVGAPRENLAGKLVPFAPNGLGGIFAAMGFTFIAFQGFDLIAAAGGEIKSPGRTIPRAMLLSLAVAMVVYLPLLFVVATVGVPAGGSVTEVAAAAPATIVAVSAQNFLGSLGFWLVVAAALLSMLSALQANLFASSRIVLAMARDRTLPRVLGQVNASGIPVAALVAGAATMAVVLLLLPNLATAGAAASLIFLTVFTLAHGISILARLRGGRQPIAFRTPYFPAVPIVGGLCCAALALFQGVVVPIAGAIALIWILIGVGIYLWLFAHQARAFDALQEARDPQLHQLRGRSPLVLAPIANPANAEVMVTVANALAPPNAGRVLLLSVVTDISNGVESRLENAQAVLRASLTTSAQLGLYPEALTTLASGPWEEIARVASTHRCESLLLGLSDLRDDAIRRRVNALMSRVDSHVVILRALPEWQLGQVERVLIPIGGKGDHEELRARVLGSLSRLGSPEVIYLRVVPTSTSEASLMRTQWALQRLTEDRSLGLGRAEVVRSDDPQGEIVRRAAASDLMILGLQRLSRQQKMFGEFARSLAERTEEHCAILMISRRG